MTELNSAKDIQDKLIEIFRSIDSPTPPFDRADKEELQGLICKAVEICKRYQTCRSVWPAVALVKDQT